MKQLYDYVIERSVLLLCTSEDTHCPYTDTDLFFFLTRVRMFVILSWFLEIT